MNIIFKKITDPEQVATYIADRLKELLASGKEVLWLVPGGSSIGVAVHVSKKLAGFDVQKLHVTLTDERYGELGHVDSNWQQLQDQGFSLPNAKLWPVLIGEDRELTTDRFAETLSKILGHADYSLGFFGIGPDGHTAGILPGSPAVSSTAFAASYDAGNFERITMTPIAIAKLDEIVVYATGEAKWPIFDQLQTTLPVEQQPAQALKTSGSPITIFNDYKDSEKNT